MSSVLSIRIPKKLKEEMDKLKDVINWSSEIRAFIEKRIREYKRLKALEEVSDALKELPETPTGFATKSVRDDRERN